MKRQPSRRGFTLVELVVTLGVAAILMAFSAPFVTALRSDMALEQTVRQVKNDLIATLTYGLAGKSFSALSHKISLEAGPVPMAYFLHFQRDEDFGDPTPYRYLEWIEGETLNEIGYEKAKPYPNAAVFLTQIRLREKLGNESVEMDSASIGILPPVGEVFLVEGDIEALKESKNMAFLKDYKTYDEIELVFQYKNDTQKQATLTFDIDKLINLSF